MKNFFVHEHNLTLVLIAFCIAVVASYTMFNLAGRVRLATENRRSWWLTMGAIILGIGIWSMHFTAMLAFNEPMQVFYNVPIVLLSFVVALVPSGIALQVASRQNLGWGQIVFGGALMGVGIVATHYVGLESMRLHSNVAYDMTISLIAVVISISTSIAALWLTASFQSSAELSSRWMKIVGAFVMGIAISGTHYVGVNAAIFTPLTGRAPVSYPFSVSIGFLGTAAVIAITVVIFTGSAVLMMVDQKLQIQEENLRLSKGDLMKSKVDLEQRVKDLEHVQIISSLCMATLDQDVLMRSVLDKLMHLFDYSDVLYYRFDQEKNSLQFYGHLVWDDSDPDQGRPINDRIVFDAAFENQTKIIEVPPTERFPGRNEVAVPVKNGDDILGILAVVVPNAGEDGRTGSYHADLLELVAYHMAMSLQNACRFEMAVTSRDEANQSNRIKTDFLSSMTRELRSPLNGVLGLTNILLDSSLSPNQKDLVNTIQFSGDSLLAIINDILDFSKIEANQIDLEAVSINLRQCIEEAFEIVAPQAAEKQINLAYTIEKNVPIHIFQDLTRLRQVITNLLGNAVKFTESGEVTLHVTTAKLEVNRYKLEFALKDTGIGISEEGIKRLFKSFSQIDGSGARRFGGTGLGLIISKRLCEMMGGMIWVESELGTGSTFYFSVMAERNVQEPAEQFSAAHVQIDERFLLDIQNQTNRNIIIDHLERWGISYKFSQGIPREWDPSSRTVLITDKLENNYEGVIQTFPQAEVILLTRRGFRRIVDSSRLHTISIPIRPHVFSDRITDIYGGGNLPKRPVHKQPQFERDMGQEFPLRILLAEDNVINQKVVLNMLKRLGYRADVAGNGIEVLDALDIKKYDLILMDTQMPGMNGADAAREIYNRMGGSPAGRPWIIALTAHALSADPQTYFEAGMDDQLTKPLRVNELIEALKKVPISENQAQ